MAVPTSCLYSFPPPRGCNESTLESSLKQVKMGGGRGRENLRSGDRLTVLEEVSSGSLRVLPKGTGRVVI